MLTVYIYRQHQLTFRASTGLTVNFLYYCASMHSVSLRQLYACPQDHLSTFRGSEGHSVNFRQLSVRPRDYLSNFVPVEHSVIFSKHSVHPRDLASTFRASFIAYAGPWVDFRHLSVFPQGLSSAFRMAAGGQGTSCQLSVWPVDFPSSFLVSAGPVNVVQLPSITR